MKKTVKIKNVLIATNACLNAQEFVYIQIFLSPFRVKCVQNNCLCIISVYSTLDATFIQAFARIFNCKNRYEKNSVLIKKIV